MSMVDVTTSDAELLSRFVNARSEEAFRALVERHAPAVHRTCMRLLWSNATLADDAAQAVFIVLARKAKEVRNPQALPAWLFRTATLVAEQARRAESTRRRREGGGEAMSVSEAAAKPAAELSEADREELYRAIGALKPGYQEAVILHYLDGRPRDDVARALGCSLEALHKRLSSALESLHGTLSRRGVALSTAALGSALAQEAAGQAVAHSGTAAAWAVAAGKGAAGTAAGAWAKGALQAMYWTKTRLATYLLSGVLLACLGSAAFFARAQEQAAIPRPVPEPAPAAPVKGPDAPAAPLEPLRVLGACAFQADSQVYALALSPDNKHLAAGMENGWVIWELETGKEVVHAGEGMRVWNVSYLDQGKKLLLRVNQEALALESSPVLLLWDVEKKKKLREYFYPKSDEKTQGGVFQTGGPVWITPDERIAFAQDGRNCGSLIAWNLETGEVAEQLSAVARPPNANQYGIDTLAFSTDGRWMACRDVWQGSQGADLNDLAEKQDEIKSVRFVFVDREKKEKPRAWHLKLKYLRCAGEITWLPGGKQLLLDLVWKRTDNPGNQDGPYTLLVDTEDGKVVREFPGNVSASGDGRRFYTLKERRLLSGPTFDEAQDAGILTPDLSDYSYTILRISGDGRWCAKLLGGQSIFLADLEKKTLRAPLGHQTSPNGLAYLGDGTLISYDGLVTRIYDDRTGKVLKTMRASWGDYYGCGRSGDGRWFIANGAGETGQAELWDAANGVMVGKLAKHDCAYVQRTSVSGNGMTGYTTGAEDGALRFHDLATGRPLGIIVNPAHEFFGRRSYIAGSCWSAKAERVYLADATTAWFHGDLATPTLETVRPIGMTGAFDPRTGKCLFRFKDDQDRALHLGRDVDLCEARGLAYLATGLNQNPDKDWKAGLFKAADGSFVRWIDFPGLPARFADEGRLLVGPDAVVDAETGKTLHTFEGGTHRFPSPSGTYVARLDATPVVRLFDIRTGCEVWQRDIVCKEIGALELERLIWHPGETQVTLLAKGKAAAFQVDLFPDEDTKAAEPATAQTLAAWTGALGSQDPAEREAAIRGLVQAGEAAHKSLSEIATGEKPSLQKMKLALLVFEWQAREGLAPARSYLETLARRPAGNLAGDCARDALTRLVAGERVRTLRQKNAQALPLTWPATVKEDTKDDF
ncbi:MAG: sigma-70 family RNA polymerase sigma factor [Planctomycetes bacterium]|nr:sigma-70 family RNA polymerase sigma factor [Planctomycetota bacterium]